MKRSGKILEMLEGLLENCRNKYNFADPLFGETKEAVIDAMFIALNSKISNKRIDFDKCIYCQLDPVTCEYLTKDQITERYGHLLNDKEKEIINKSFTNLKLKGMSKEN